MSQPSILNMENGDLDFNQSQINRFEFVFSNLPNVTYTLNEVQLPGMSMTNPEVSTIFNNVSYGADAPMFDPLTINFLVQEDLANYLEIHDWMRAISFPDSFRDREDLKRFGGSNHSGFLTINDSYNRPLYRFHFENIIPNSLMALNLQASDAQEIFASATFNYTIYHREKVDLTKE